MTDSPIRAITFTRLGLLALRENHLIQFIKVAVAEIPPINVPVKREERLSVLVS